MHRLPNDTMRALLVSLGITVLSISTAEEHNVFNLDNHEGPCEEGCTPDDWVDLYRVYLRYLYLDCGAGMRTGDHLACDTLHHVFKEPWTGQRLRYGEEVVRHPPREKGRQILQEGLHS
jgi:hypothetical protein